MNFNRFGLRKNVNSFFLCIALAGVFAGHAQDPVSLAVQQYQRGYIRKAWATLEPLKKSKALTADGEFCIGSIYYHGEAGVERSYEEALKWFKKAAKDGNNDALAEIGLLYRYGNGVSKNKEKELQYYREAAAKGSAYGQKFLGDAYADGDGVPQDETEALTWYKLSAAQGYWYGIITLAGMYEKGQGTEKNIPEAVRLYMLMVKKENDEDWANKGWGVVNLNKLGYSEKTGLPLNAAEQAKAGVAYCNDGRFDLAFPLLSALSVNTAPASFPPAAAKWLGYMYDVGAGTQQDYKEAAKWYLVADAGGDTAAPFNLGILYHMGRGVAQDYAEAMRWYKKAAALGHIEAQNNVGYLYEWGYGVPKDYTEALKWFRLSAAKGYDMAEYNLGMVYRNGWGVKQDERESQAWLGKAAAKGNKLAEALYVRETASTAARPQQQPTAANTGKPYTKGVCSCCNGRGYNIVYASQTYQKYDQSGTKVGIGTHYINVACSCCGGTGYR